MLIKYSIANYLSFNEKQSFSLKSGKAQNKKDHLIKGKNFNILKFNALYGANASGKSNLLKSIHTAQSLIVDIDPFKKDSIGKPFKYKEGNSNISEFEFELYIRSNTYQYSFEVDIFNCLVYQEKLVDISNGKNKIVFERNYDAQSKSYIWNFKNLSNKKTKARLNIYIEDMNNSENSNHLFLNYLNHKISPFYKEKGKADNELLIIREIYEWFADKLVVFSRKKISDFKILFNDSEIAKVSETISGLDLGISDIEFQEITDEDLLKRIYDGDKYKFDSIQEFSKNSIIANENYCLTFFYEKELYYINKSSDSYKIYKIIFKLDQYEISLKELSNGTIAVLQIIWFILLTKGKTVFIDELAGTLHPLLIKKIIEVYLDTSKKINQQLIIVSHQSYIMDFKLIRQDEIHFIEKLPQYASHIMELDSFNERKDKKLSKSYLEGNYHAVPKIASDSK